MSIVEIMRNRRTIHSYRAESVDQEIVNQALELSLWAPNHRLTMPWRYIQSLPQSRELIANLGVQIKSKGKELSLTAQAEIKKKYTTPSHLIVVMQKKYQESTIEKEDYATIACGLQNASLYLWEKGIGTKWSSGSLTTHEETYKIFRINPDENLIVGFFWIGWPEKIPAPKERPRLGDVLQAL